MTLLAIDGITVKLETKTIIPEPSPIPEPPPDDTGVVIAAIVLLGLAALSEKKPQR